MVSLVKAVAYRELVWFRRFLADYIVSWILPPALSLMVVLLPASVGGIDTVLARLSSMIGTNVGVREMLLVSITVSGLVPVVALTITDICQTLFAEFRYLEVSSMLLEATSLRGYMLANAIVRAPLMTLCTTLYLAPALVLLLGPSGLLVYAYVESVLQLSSVVLGLYSTVIAALLTFYTNLSRPWTVANSIPPAILAGSGIYVQGYSVPLLLRAIASTTPVPQVGECLKLVAVGISLPHVVSALAVATVLLVLYLTLAGFVSVRADARVRR